MRLPGLLFLFLASPCFPAPDLGGRLCLLWIPPEFFSDWAGLGKVLDQNPQVNLTLGLAPGMLTPTGESILPAWIGAKRLEVALRLKGDPLLPMIAEHPLAARPQDAVDRMAAGREQYRLVFGTTLSGFVPAGGAVGPAVFAALHAMQLSWVAIGNYPDSSLWSGSGLDFVPFKPVPPLADPLESGFWALDESRAPLDSRPLERLSRLIAQNKPSAGWTTVAQALKAIGAKQRMVAEGESWPAWNDDLENSRFDPYAQQAWKLYGSAAKAVEEYQNSGSADLELLEEAARSLHQAQASRFYRKPLDPKVEQELEREFKGHIAAVYRKLGNTPPAEAVYVDPAVILDSLRASASDFSLVFHNPVSSLSRDLGAKILSLKIEWDVAAVTLIYKMAKLRAEPSHPYGELLWQTYIDLNNIAGAGSTSLLDNSKAFIQPRDAWEYALTASRTGAFLYRSSPRSAPAKIGEPKVKTDFKKSEIIISVPRALLKGNPLQWGYIAGVMGAAPDASGSMILGLLGELAQQKAALGKMGTRPPHLAAVRAGK